jgi:predicted  nucleic acid-binding Zn-ribbon protein
MLETTEIEKKSLEAHVELCAERYNALEDKMAVLSDHITNLCTMVKEVKDAVSKMADKRNDQIMAWGLGIIGFLVATTGWLLMHYVIK